MQVNLKHHSTGAMKQTKLGFSWTMIFFGGFVPLFRGDVKWFLLTWIVAVVTFGLAWFIFPFVYNKMYIKDLVEKGYIPADETSTNALNAAGIQFSSPKEATE